jgi:methyltransferase-like protein/ubiquinone/menaquinone biosynthesis C-methylase UbiE
VAVKAATTYDLLPYSSKPYALTHPDNLATVAGLAGLRAPSLEHCRVLELGSGAGGNLIPMAVSLPGATLVGIDRSERQIADARKLADAAGLTNLTFLVQNILAIDESLGRFDFVICHGVFSWVPPDVQDAILTICRRNLEDSGLAFVSYNAYPGWHLKGVVREMLLQRVRTTDEPQEQVRQARSVLEQTGRDLADRRDGYSRLLRARVAAAASGSDTYLFHDYMEEVNQPIYFQEFVERAQAHGLQYVGDAKLRATAPAAPDRVEREQHGDFIVNRSFRRSLLCHADARLDPEVAAASLLDCHVMARTRPLSAAPDVDSDTAEEFTGPDERPWSTSNRLEKALLVSVASHYPATLSFSELAVEIGRRLTAAPDAADLAESLQRCWAAELVDLRLQPPQLPERIAERPTASPLARAQAQAGPEVTNLRHHSVGLDPVAQAMLCLLDGAHDRAALASELRVLAERRPPSVADLDAGGREAERWRNDIDGSLDRMLRFFQRTALLVS